MKTTTASELEFLQSDVFDGDHLDAFGNPWAYVTDDVQTDGSILRHIGNKEDLIIPAVINLALE